jgi:hypothetical protein
LLGVQEVPGSNPGGPTKFLKDLQTSDLPKGSTPLSGATPIPVLSLATQHLHSLPVVFGLKNCVVTLK